MSRTATGPCGACKNTFNYGKMTYFAAEMFEMSNDKDIKVEDYYLMLLFHQKNNVPASNMSGSSSKQRN